MLADGETLRIADAILASSHRLASWSSTATPFGARLGCSVKLNGGQVSGPWNRRSLNERLTSLGSNGPSPLHGPVFGP